MKKTTTLGVATLAVIGVVGVVSLNASALTGNGTQTDTQQRNGNGNGGGRQASLESRAQVLGMTADELTTALKTKTMSQIAKERGMSETAFRTKMRAVAKARWEARGLSSEEIAKRIADRDARHAANAADHEWGSGAGSYQGYGRNR